MDFLLEPMELGKEYENLLDPSLATIECDKGYACEVGRVKPDAS